MSQKLTFEIQKCAEVILSGGTILYPTDTIWGLGCDATNEKSVNRIYNIKNRPLQKSLIILLPNAKSIMQYVATPPIDLPSILKQFTNPTTIIFQNAINLPDTLISDDGSIAIRVPNDSFCKQLLMKIKRPLISTSANVSGQLSPQHFSQIPDTIKQQVDYIVQYRQDDTTPKSPSNIIKILTDGTLLNVR